MIHKLRYGLAAVAGVWASVVAIVVALVALRGAVNLASLLFGDAELERIEGPLRRVSESGFAEVVGAVAAITLGGVAVFGVAFLVVEGLREWRGE